MSELLGAFRAGEGIDLIRESVRMVTQELIEAETTERIGAGRYERNVDRVTDRNGADRGWSRPRARPSIRLRRGLPHQAQARGRASSRTVLQDGGGPPPDLSQRIRHSPDSRSAA